MSRPLALDLFCCAGGASMGLYRAGFDVIGVDIDHQPNYPFKFVQADATKYPLDRAAFVWASPPCQGHSPLNAYNKKTYPMLVGIMRDLLRRSGIPYAIENVVQAPLINPVVLCGTMFGLSVYRHRGIETSFSVEAPEHHRHHYRCARNGYLPHAERPFMTITGGKHSVAWLDAARRAMGVEWMHTTREVCEAIPPAYAEFIGRAALQHIQQRTAA